MEIAGCLLFLTMVWQIVKRLLIPIIVGVLALYFIGYLQFTNDIEIFVTDNALFNSLNQLPQRVYEGLYAYIQPTLDYISQFIQSILKEMQLWY